MFSLDRLPHYFTFLPTLPGILKDLLPRKMDSEKAYQQVQDHYGSVARAQNSSYSNTIAKAFGYSEEELNSIPKDANLGLSCGNPLAIASLREASLIATIPLDDKLNPSPGRDSHRSR